MYDLMRETGLREGILFLDEINCVSETLAPCMLQFLQYKVFGQHRLPPGWILVTAGNPPEYNKSVRDFDVVTWDRLKRIDVEPDYDTWREYALQKGVHPAVMTYLSARKKDFYKVENAADGKHFVTARGWDDLSEMIYLYEANGLEVNELLTAQYLQDARIARDFAIYYGLFNKYRSDYQVERILDGTADENIILRAQRAGMDERLSVLGLIFDSVTHRLRGTCELENVLEQVTKALRELKSGLAGGKGNAGTILERIIGEREEQLAAAVRASSISREGLREAKLTLRCLDEVRGELLRRGTGNAEADFALVKNSYDAKVGELKESAAAGTKALDNTFTFCEQAFTDGDEVLLFVTELTANYYSARFIGHYGCDKYYLHNKELQFQERRQEIMKQIDSMDLNL